MKYKVRIDDNFHWHDDSDGVVHAEFATFEEAEECCKAIIDRSLSQMHNAKMTWRTLLEQYEFSGAEPYILPNDGKFSAKSYARKRCSEICAK